MHSVHFASIRKARFLFRGDEPVALSHRAMELLRVLVDRQGHAGLKGGVDAGGLARPRGGGMHWERFGSCRSRAPRASAHARLSQTRSLQTGADPGRICLPRSRRNWAEELWVHLPAHLPASSRLRLRAAASFSTRRVFSYSAKAPATWRIILRLGSARLTELGTGTVHKLKREMAAT